MWVDEEKFYSFQLEIGFKLTIKLIFKQQLIKFNCCFFDVRPAWALTRWCKSTVDLSSRNYEPRPRVSAVRWNLKEAWSKVLNWWTRSGHNAVVRRWGCITNWSLILLETDGSKAAGYLAQKSAVLPGKVCSARSGTAAKSGRQNKPDSDAWPSVTEVSRGHSSCHRQRRAEQ